MVAPDQAAVQRVIDDAYGKLGLPRGASTEKIKRAYHKLALRYHPVRVCFRFIFPSQLRSSGRTR